MSATDPVVYGPQSREDLPHPPPPPDQPVCIIAEAPDGTWVYRWWDRSADFVGAGTPTRHKEYYAFTGLLAALLADRARCIRSVLDDQADQT